MLDQLEFLNEIGRQDDRIAGEVASAKLNMQETRNSTRRTRRQVAETTRRLPHGRPSSAPSATGSPGASAS